MGRMPLETVTEQLQEIAKKYKPTEVRVLPRRDFPHLCGFVIFDNVQNAKQFTRAYDGSAALGGCHTLNVKFSDGKNSCRKVFIGGLAAGITADALEEVVSQYGTVLMVNILQTNSVAPCAFIIFATAEEAALCIQKLHNSINSDGTKKYVARRGKSCIAGKTRAKCFDGGGGSDQFADNNAAIAPTSSSSTKQDTRTFHTQQRRVNFSADDNAVPVSDDFQQPVTKCDAQTNQIVTNAFDLTTANTQFPQLYAAGLLNHCVQTNNITPNYVSVAPAMLPQQPQRALPAANCQMVETNQMYQYYALQPQQQQLQQQHPQSPNQNQIQPNACYIPWQQQQVVQEQQQQQQMIVPMPMTQANSAGQVPTWSQVPAAMPNQGAVAFVPVVHTLKR